MRAVRFSISIGAAVAGMLLLVGAFLLARQTRVALSQAQTGAEELARRSASAKANLEKLQRQLSALVQPPTKVVAPVSSAPTQQRNPRSPFVRAQDDPKLQNLQLIAQRARFRSEYDPLFRSLHLSPDQIDSFIQLLSKKSEQQADLFAAIATNNSSSSDPNMGNLLRGLNDSLSESIKALIGSENYQQYQDYEQTVGVRAMVADMAGAASMAGTPYTPAELESLIQIIARSSLNAQLGHEPHLDDVDWEKADLQARAILSPSQFFAFQNLETMSLSIVGTRSLTRLNNSIEKAAAADALARENGTSAPKP